MLILTLSPDHRSHPLLILLIQIGTFVDEELDHLEPIAGNGIVDWTLVLGVELIEDCAVVNEELGHFDVTLSHGVVNRSLTVLVLPVHILSAMIYEERDYLAIAFTAGVKDGRLL